MKNERNGVDYLMSLGARLFQVNPDHLAVRQAQAGQGRPVVQGRRRDPIYLYRLAGLAALERPSFHPVLQNIIPTHTLYPTCCTIYITTKTMDSFTVNDRVFL